MPSRAAWTLRSPAGISPTPRGTIAPLWSPIGLKAASAKGEGQETPFRPRRLAPWRVASGRLWEFAADQMCLADPGQPPMVDDFFWEPYVYGRRSSWTAPAPRARLRAREQAAARKPPRCPVWTCSATLPASSPAPASPIPIPVLATMVTSFPSQQTASWCSTCAGPKRRRPVLLARPKRTALCRRSKPGRSRPKRRRPILFWLTRTALRRRSNPSPNRPRWPSACG